MISFSVKQITTEGHVYFSLHVKLKQYQKLNPNIIESSISIRISHNVMRERMNSRKYIFLYKECKQHIKGRLFYTLHFLPPPPYTLLFIPLSNMIIPQL